MTVRNSQKLLALVMACWWVAAGARIAAATNDYVITYTDLVPQGSAGGGLTFTSGYLHGGAIASRATIWAWPGFTPIDLHPSNSWTSSTLMGGTDYQQVGYVYRSIWPGPRAALWYGSAASYVNLNPSWALHSIAYAASGTQQAGSATATVPFFQVRAGFWSGTAASFVDLHPGVLHPEAISSQAYAMAGNQQGGMVNYNGVAQAALWSGTPASYRNLHPVGLLEHSEILGMTPNQQVGYAGRHAGIWFGTAASFKDFHPVGADYSEIHATIDTAQVGHATYNFSRRAILWLGSADNYLDLQPVLGSLYRDSEANGISANGNTLLVAGTARDRMGKAHHILWNILLPCTISCPSNVVVCADPGECGSVVRFPEPVAANCAGFLSIECVPRSGSFFPIGTNVIACAGTDFSGQVQDSCSFEVVVRDCEPPVSCPTNIVVCADAGECGAVVRFSEPVASHCSGLNFECVPSSGAFFSIGTNVVACAGTDFNGQVQDSCSFEVVVRDREPPVIHGLSASPRMLWPPNNRMQPVSVTVAATDNCELAACKIISVSSQEPDSKENIGLSDADGELTGDLTLNLRAERSRGGKSRIYTIVIECTDAAGNSSTRTVTVTMPHDQRARVF